MNERIDLDFVLDEWMRDGPNTVPDRVIDRVAEQIDRQRQWPARRFHGRPILMSRTFQIAVALAAALSIVFGGLSLLPRSYPGTGGVHQTASPAPSFSPSESTGPTPIAGVTPDPSAPSWLSTTPAPSMSCEDNIPGCAGPLFFGVHRSWHLDPRLFYAVMNGTWTNSIDSTGIFKLDFGANRDPYILVWVNPGIAHQSATCSNIPQPGPHDAAAWRAFLTSQPGIVLTNLVPVDLVGSADSNGFEVDVSLAPGWTTTCPYSDVPMVPFLSWPGSTETNYGVDANGRLHMMVVDGPLRTSPGTTDEPSTMVIETFGPLDVTRFQENVRAAQSVLHTFRFGCGPSVGYGQCGTESELPTPSQGASALPG